MALGILKILVRVKSHRIQRVFSFIDRQFLNSSYNVLLHIGRRHILLLIFLFLIITLFFFNCRPGVHFLYSWFEAVAFLSSFAFALTLRPLLAFFIQVAILLTVEAFSFLDEFQTFFIH
jgi:hypothetical protein